MRATSTRTGHRRAGTITIDCDGLRYSFRYSRGGVGRAKHDLTIEPGPGALAVGAFGNALSAIARDAAEALDDGPIVWRLDEIGGVYTHTATTDDADLGDATGAHGSRAAWQVAS